MGAAIRGVVALGALAALVLVLTALVAAVWLVLLVWRARRDRPRLRLAVMRTRFALTPPPAVTTTPGLVIHVVNRGRRPVHLPGWMALVLADQSTFALSDPVLYQGRVWGVLLGAGQGWSVTYPRMLWQRELAAGQAACVGVQIVDASATVWQVRLRRELADWFNSGAGRATKVL
jgi:hypothetical protein